MQDEKDGNRTRFCNAYPNTKSPLSRDHSRFSLFGCFASIAPTGADSSSSTGSSSVGSDRVYSSGTDSSNMGNSSTGDSVTDGLSLSNMSDRLEDVGHGHIPSFNATQVSALGSEEPRHVQNNGIVSHDNDAIWIYADDSVVFDEPARSDESGLARVTESTPDNFIRERIPEDDDLTEEIFNIAWKTKNPEIFNDHLKTLKPDLSDLSNSAADAGDIETRAPCEISEGLGAPRPQDQGNGSILPKDPNKKAWSIFCFGRRN